MSSEQGNLGMFYITNVRVVWFAQLSESFNVSLPWIQVKTVKIRESKYGTALVLETSEFSGGYVLGFRIEELEKAYEEISNLFRTYSANPVFGVEKTFEDIEKNLSEVTVPVIEDKVDIIEDDTSKSQAFRAYQTMAATSYAGEDEIVYSEELGLAV